MTGRSSNRRATEAAAAILRARGELALARQRLAEATDPGHEDVIVAPGWKNAARTLKARRERLLGIPGVVGVGLGYPRRDHVVTPDAPHIIVYVTRKYSPRVLKTRGVSPIPRSLRAGKGAPVKTDVVAFGKLVHQSYAGAGIGPAKLEEMGTLGTFAVDVTGNLVALTAMHVTGEREFPPGTPIGIVSPSRIEGGARPFGIVMRGTRSGIDAAKISVLDPSSVTTDIAEIGAVRGWRPLSNPGDRNTAVRMFGARTGHAVVGRIVEPMVELPQYGLDAAILVDIPSVNGDSGAAIVDNEHLVLGLLIGESSQLHGLRVFNPISRVLAQLGCNIPTSA